MPSPRRRALHFLLAGLVVLVGLPKMELRHAHANGGDPHHHGEAESRHEHHEHDHLGDGHDDHSHHREVEANRDAIDPVSMKSGIDWHTHHWWFGGLMGEDWLPVNEIGNSTLVDSVAPEFCDSRSPTSTPCWLEALALLICLHGPPYWLAAPPPAPRPSRTNLDRGASPPLCDRARHERSGVQLT